MLANLLPGIRELRAPLAAGYIWLIALWLTFEPGFPNRAGADGLLASLYRLTDELSTVGIGVVVSFVAYIVGALSTSLFATPRQGVRRLRMLGKTKWLDPYSAQARAALAEIGRSTRVELEGILSMSGFDVGELLDEAQVPADPSGQPVGKPYRRKSTRASVRSRLRQGPGSAAPRDFEGDQQARIAHAVTRDLDTIATTRLLGRDQELYSAIDRLRAEMEFRRAIVPPLMFAAVVLAVRIGWPWWVVVAVAAMLLCGGLVVDAAGLERRMNDLLLDVLTDNRVESPTLERLRSQAKAVAGRTAIDDAEQSASRLAAEIRRALKRLQSLGVSEPSLADMASSDVALAREALEKTKLVWPEDLLIAAAQSLEILADLSEKWVKAMSGSGFDSTSGQHELARAEGLYEHFLSDAKHRIADMRERENTVLP